MNAVVNERQILTPGRKGLAHHLGQIRAAAAEVERTREPLSRLETTAEAARRAQVHLEELEAAHSKALSDWAEGKTDHQPVPPVELEAARQAAAAAQQQAEAASAVADRFAEPHRAAIGRLNSSNGETRAYVAAVLVEDAERLAGERERLLIKAAQLSAEIEGIRQVLATGPHRNDGAAARVREVDGGVGHQIGLDQSAVMAAAARAQRMAGALADDPAAKL